MAVTVQVVGNLVSLGLLYYGKVRDKNCRLLYSVIDYYERAFVDALTRNFTSESMTVSYKILVHSVSFFLNFFCGLTGLFRIRRFLIWDYIACHRLPRKYGSRNYSCILPNTTVFKLLYYFRGQPAINTSRK